jgi:hypothetical protein
MLDEQDRITVAEYRGNKVAVFGTRAEKFTEYDLPPRIYPYRGGFRQERCSSTTRPRR